MNPRSVVVTFSAAVVAVVVGWFAGALARDTIGAQPEVAIGVVDAEAGVPVTSSSPTPAPTQAPVSETPSETPTASALQTPTPAVEQGPCPGTPPDDNCVCKERKRNSRWVCPLDDDDDADD